ncbi:MAG: sulfatase-like hydrolase/transferase [Patescibacteria group bacterium]
MSRHVSWVGGGFVLVVLVALAFFTPARPCSSGCNVILIMVDTLAGNHLATHGYLRDTMPHTTAFFEDGVIFEDASTNAPWTLPSFSSMYFSAPASTITFAELDDGSKANLPQTLREHGVSMRVIRPKGENFIFDTITRLFEPEEITWSKNDQHSSIDVASEELSRLHTQGPFFLVVHTFEAHDPYKPNEPYSNYFSESDAPAIVTMPELVALNATNASLDPATIEAIRLRYDQQLAQTDTHLGDFLTSIPEDVLANTVVIFASDHGEGFGEHGKVWHGVGLFQEELHIPLMMRVPNVTRRVTEPVSLMDLAPTILSFMHIPIPDSFYGDSLLPVMTGSSLGERTLLFVNGFPYFRKPGDITNIQTNLETAGAAGRTVPIIEPVAFGVRSGDTKVLRFMEGRWFAGLHWYDLSKDPSEHMNLASDATPPQSLVNALSELESLSSGFAH